MKRLVFDTSSPWVVVGIWGPEGWEGSIERAEAQTQSKELFAVLQELLEFHQVSRKEITEIAVGVGPGSYTGLRIGLTVAKIWAFSAKIPLYRFSSDTLMARTREKKPESEGPELRFLELADFEKVEDVNALIPVYTNDHFS